MAQKGFAMILLILGVVILALLATWFYFPRIQQMGVYSTPSATFKEGEETLVSGLVMSNDGSKLPVDGLGVVTIQSGDGMVKLVYGGDVECANGSTKVAMELKAGDLVEVLGKTSGSQISACERSNYYVKKLSQSPEDVK